MLITDLILGIYVIYMFNYFQTSSNFQLSINKFLTDGSSFLSHSYNDQISNKICQLGHAVGWVFGLFLVFRYLLPATVRHNLTLLSLIGISIGGLLLNFNVTIYLLPVWLAVV